MQRARAAAFGCLSAAVLIAVSTGCATARDVRAVARSSEPALASWREGASRDAIVDFVARTTDPASPDFVPEAERIAVFDNDGTLWAEQPMYVQLAFIVDRVKALRAQHPEWESTEPFASLLRGDAKAVAAQGEHALAALVAATHGGMTDEEFRTVVREWLATARHPKTGLRYDAMVYQPMLEVLAHLRANGYRTFIVSGGGVDFVRAFAGEVYGIPTDQVVGSTARYRYESNDGVPRVVKTGEIDFVDDKEGKPVGIASRIGMRPRIAFGNSDGDFAMLEWTTAGGGARLGVLVHHTDGVREWAYDRASHIGKLARGLDEAPARGWVVVDMARDWTAIYAASSAR
ncbi:MAG: haloacid dehalogenase-like hydrolase [Phycisphaera sp.]|nr:haloacid dehalogenase-like hydrolase [Phycisphaera sp.]